MSNLLLITNGNNQIGLGHVSRTRDIAAEFSSKGWTVTVVLDQGFKFSNLLGEFDTVLLDYSDKSLEFKLNGILNRCRIDLVIIDLIEAEYDAFSFLRQYSSSIFIVSITLFLFEKSKRYEHLSLFPTMDRLFDENVGQEGKTKVVGNSNFFSIRESFFEKEFKVKESADRVLVSAGGTDPFSITKKVVESLKDTSLKVTILLSENALDYDRLEEFCSHRENFVLKDLVSDLALEMGNADLIILNGGLTRYEACAVGIPFIAISIHEEQRIITEAVTSKGAGINLGVINELSLKDISNIVQNLLNSYESRREMSEKARGLFHPSNLGPSAIYRFVFQEYINFSKVERA